MRRCSRMVISGAVDEWNAHTIVRRQRTFHDSMIHHTTQIIRQQLECTQTHRIATVIQIQRKCHKLTDLLKVFRNLFISMFIFDIFDSLTSQWLNPQSMNAYQSCPSRNTFGYSTQIPSAVQSINSFPSLSNNIGELKTKFPFLFNFSTSFWNL